VLQEVWDGADGGVGKHVLPVGEHLVHCGVAVTRGEEGEGDLCEPSPVNKEAAEAKEPPVLVLPEAVVHLKLEL